MRRHGSGRARQHDSAATVPHALSAHFSASTQPPFPEWRTLTAKRNETAGLMSNSMGCPPAPPCKGSGVHAAASRLKLVCLAPPRRRVSFFSVTENVGRGATPSWAVGWGSSRERGRPGEPCKMACYACRMGRPHDYLVRWTVMLQPICTQHVAELSVRAARPAPRLAALCARLPRMALITYSPPGGRPTRIRKWMRPSCCRAPPSPQLNSGRPCVAVAGGQVGPESEYVIRGWCVACSMCLKDMHQTPCGTAGGHLERRDACTHPSRLPCCLAARLHAVTASEHPHLICLQQLHQ